MAKTEKFLLRLTEVAKKKLSYISNYDEHSQNAELEMLINKRYTAITELEAIEKSKCTNDKILVRKYTEECDGTMGDKCCVDVIIIFAENGKIIKERNHTF